MWFLLAALPHLLAALPEDRYALAALHAATPVWTAVLAVAVVVTARRRQRLPVAVLGASLLLGWVQHPWVVLPTAPPEGPAVRLATANLRFGNPRPEAVYDALLAERPDVVALQELTGGHLAALGRHPLGAALPHCVAEARPHGFGIALCARWPLAGGSIRSWGDVPVARGTVTVDGVPVTVVAVHAIPPSTPAMIARREAQLATIGSLAGAGRTVILGDLNTTPDEPAWRHVTTAGFRTAAAHRGLPRRPTWPLPLPGARLDHVLLPDGVGCAGLTHRHPPGTDHAAVIADLRLPSVPGT